MYEFSPDQLRQYLDISLPVDVVAIANFLGYSVKYADINSADAYIICDIKRLIVVCKDMFETRKRFSIAHEIGHLMCGHNFYELNCNNIGNSFITQEKASLERAADEYAALLLMPETEIKLDMKKEFNLGSAISNASKKYNVSLESYLIRLAKRADFPLCVSKLEGELVRWNILSNSWPEEIDLGKIPELAGRKKTHVREWLNEDDPEEYYYIISEKVTFGNNQAILVLYTSC